MQLDGATSEGGRSGAAYPQGVGEQDGTPYRGATEHGTPPSSTPSNFELIAGIFVRFADNLSRRVTMFPGTVESGILARLDTDRATLRSSA